MGDRDLIPEVPVPGLRHLALPDGRRLVIRPVELDDIEGLAALYEDLATEDLHNRFFSVYHPDRRFLERLVSTRRQQGFGLVAVAVTDREGRDEGPLVGEAGYTLLANGDGDLGITVAREWRGRLGRALLDALLEAAAAHGVRNLEADILMTNARMLALARSYGVAIMPADDWVSVRLVMGTRGRMPTWPDDGRPRVLVEVPGGRWCAGHAASQAGLQVLTCSGPRPGRPRCPVLDGRPCPLAATADAIVISHPPDDEQWAAVVDAHATRHPGVPVCTEPSASMPSDEGFVAVVERLARRHSRSAGRLAE